MGDDKLSTPRRLAPTPQRQRSALPEAQALAWPTRFLDVPRGERVERRGS